jgi:hypothetical protein
MPTKKKKAIEPKIAPTATFTASSLEAELDQLLDPGPAARVLHLQPQTLAKWRCMGRHDLPFVRVGRLVRYRKRDLLAFLEANTVRA